MCCTGLYYISPWTSSASQVTLRVGNKKRDREVTQTNFYERFGLNEKLGSKIRQQEANYNTTAYASSKHLENKHIFCTYVGLIHFPLEKTAIVVQRSFVYLVACMSIHSRYYSMMFLPIQESSRTLRRTVSSPQRLLSWHRLLWG